MPAEYWGTPYYDAPSDRLSQLFKINQYLIAENVKPLSFYIC